MLPLGQDRQRNAKVLRTDPKAKDPDDGRVYEGIGERPGPSVERDSGPNSYKQSKRFVPYWKSWGRCQTENAELKCKANADGGCRPQQHGGTQDLRCCTWVAIWRNLDLASSVEHNVSQKPHKGKCTNLRSLVSHDLALLSLF